MYAFIDRVREFVQETVIPICFAVIACFAIVNMRTCEIRRLETIVEQAKVCKEAGGLFQTGDCLKNPGTGK